jgi:hypothetical protein
MPTPPSTQVKPADAHPSKEFFTETLPRDIPLSDCIMDLVDNSIHSLVTLRELDVSEHLFAGTHGRKINGSIDISFTASKFTMVDDCGGITIQAAEEYVFRLGAPVKDNELAGLGVYGIGMKRAFFKIGKEIAISSRTKEDTFKIDINVDAWLTSPDWNFPFTYAKKEKSKETGTTIVISKLHPAIGEQFSSHAFRNILLEKMSRAFALFLKAGLAITVNGRAAEADIPELAESKDVKPVRQRSKKDGVDILIMAGLSPKADRTPRGWYVFCNGRLVLDADKSEKTGWGQESQPSFHYKYNHFLGYVYFRSTDLWKLPWTTTKDGVDRESAIYQTALGEMRVISRPILTFLNTFYEDVKEIEQPERMVLEKAKAVSPLTVAARRNSPAFEVRVAKAPAESLVSIQYKRPKKKLEQIKDALGKRSMSATRIGEYTFDWFYERNCK